MASPVQSPMLRAPSSRASSFRSGERAELGDGGGTGGRSAEADIAALDDLLTAVSTIRANVHDILMRIAEADDFATAAADATTGTTALSTAGALQSSTLRAQEGRKSAARSIRRSVRTAFQNCSLFTQLAHTHKDLVLSPGEAEAVAAELQHPSQVDAVSADLDSHRRWLQSMSRRARATEIDKRIAAAFPRAFDSVRDPSDAQPSAPAAGLQPASCGLERRVGGARGGFGSGASKRARVSAVPPATKEGADAFFDAMSERTGLEFRKVQLNFTGETVGAVVVMDSIFHAAIKFASGVDALVVASVKISGCHESVGEYQSSRFDVFALMSAEAAKAVTYFNTHCDDAAERFFVWLSQYADIFSRPCKRCNKFLLRDSKAHLFVLPVVRTFASFNAYHGQCYRLENHTGGDPL